MATVTTNYGLRKPEGSDFVEESTDISANMDIIDTEIRNAAPFYANFVPNFANLTLGNATNVTGRFRKDSGGHVHMRVSFTAGSTTALNASQAQLVLPVPALNASGIQSIPLRYYTSGVSQFLGFCTTGGADWTRVFLYTPSGSSFNNTVGIVAGSNVDICGCYEAAP